MSAENERLRQHDTRGMDIPALRWYWDLFELEWKRGRRDTADTFNPLYVVDSTTKPSHRGPVVESDFE